MRMSPKLEQACDYLEKQEKKQKTIESDLVIHHGLFFVTWNLWLDQYVIMRATKVLSSSTQNTVHRYVPSFHYDFGTYQRGLG